MVPDLYFQEELLREEGLHYVREDGSLPALGPPPARPPEGRGQRRRALVHGIAEGGCQFDDDLLGDLGNVQFVLLPHLQKFDVLLAQSDAGRPKPCL